MEKTDILKILTAIYAACFIITLLVFVILQNWVNSIFEWFEGSYWNKFIGFPYEPINFFSNPISALIWIAGFAVIETVLVLGGLGIIFIINWIQSR